MVRHIADQGHRSERSGRITHFARIERAGKLNPMTRQLLKRAEQPQDQMRTQRFMKIAQRLKS